VLLESRIFRILRAKNNKVHKVVEENAALIVNTVKEKCPDITDVRNHTYCTT